MGITFAPLGAMLPGLFPTRLRYTGTSVAYNLGAFSVLRWHPYRATSGHRGWPGVRRLLSFDGGRYQLSQRTDHTRDNGQGPLELRPGDRRRCRVICQK
jgi:hypothetical protein